MTTKTYLPLFSGFYGSIWDDPCFDGEEEYYGLPDGVEFYEFVDWKSYHEAIAKRLCDEVEELLSDFVSEIKFESIISPNYYNYTNDSINCEITFDKRLINSYIARNNESFKEYIKSRYTSYDGFTSFYSNDSVEWLEDWWIDPHKVGSILQFICESEGFEEPFDLYDLHISHFYNDEINKYAL